MGILETVTAAKAVTDKEQSAGLTQEVQDALMALTKIRAEARKKFLEREQEIDGLLTAFLAEEHVLLLGPPGTAKSALAEALTGAVDNSTFFGWLMTKFSVPEEVFGPISLKALENDEVRRITKAKLPESNVAFLDEIFKANSSILNSLLTIINERKFYNGNGKPMTVPLWSMIGASNELPDGDDLGALYDRFCVRFWTSYLYDRGDQETLLRAPRKRSSRKMGLSASITQDQLRVLQDAVYDVDVPAGLIDNVLQIKAELEQDGLVSSDRRWKQAVHVIAAKALLEGRMTADDEDLDILAHMLWREPSQIQMVASKVGHIAAPMLSDAREALDAAKESHQMLLKSEGTDDFGMQTIDTRGVLKQSKKKIQALIDTAQKEGRSTGKVGKILRQISQMQVDVKRRADKDLDG